MVNLVDISHPSQVKKRASKYSSVTVIEDDITGGLIESIYTQERIGSLSELTFRNTGLTLTLV
ncbi:MAG: hypothetical protein R2727_06590 [Bacteroidales bacterium]